MPEHPRKHGQAPTETIGACSSPSPRSRASHSSSAPSWSWRWKRIGVVAPRGWDFKDATEARYGSVIAGNWTPPIENNNPAVVGGTVDEGPYWPGRLQ